MSTPTPVTPGAEPDPVAVPATVDAYLARLDRASRGHRRSVRADLRALVWTSVAREVGGDPAPARVAAALAALGQPEDLAAGSGGVPAAPAGKRAAPPSWTCIHLLGASALTLGVTTVVGVIRLWRDREWRRLHVLSAIMLIVLGGVLVPLLTPLGTVVGGAIGLVAVGPLGAAGYLAAVRKIAP
ncbi:hypothetical protein LWC33_15455 [Pseudonocardia sp. RS11V-5]|uniref:hypothetical protein n=1 Tax=Pseudonocardia terrae TaxID=2905831 RepID=UPI001E2ABA61|nr:hypothetical protein [Pseudonocardia terrae]MCE3552848.1 hypothetical protein [Pseudonocardia terrae]